MSARQRRRAGARDPHPHIAAWLIDGAYDELPRDVIVHASLCADCRRQIAAFDMLTSVDLERAGPPPRLAAAEAPIGHGRRRMALAAGGAMAVSAAAVVAGAAATGWRPPLGGIGAEQTDRPTQEVLGNTGQPQATSSPTHSQRAVRTPAASASASATATITPTLAPPVTLPTPVATGSATPRPHATATPRISPTVAPTPSPTPATASPSPAPTPTPTPSDSPSPTP